MNEVMSAVLVSSAALCAGLCAGSAQAATVSWSVGINAPGIGTVISNLPAYPVQVYVPAPVYAPVPVYVPVPVYQPVYRSAYDPVYRPAYAARPAQVAYPRRGGGYRPVPVVYWRGHDKHGWEPRWGHDIHDIHDIHDHHGEHDGHHRRGRHD